MSIPVDRADLHTLGTNFVINQMDLDRHSYDEPSTSNDPRFSRNQLTLGLPALWPTLVHATVLLSMNRRFRMGHAAMCRVLQVRIEQCTSDAVGPSEAILQRVLTTTAAG